MNHCYTAVYQFRAHLQSFDYKNEICNITSMRLLPTIAIYVSRSIYTSECDRRMEVGRAHSVYLWYSPTILCSILSEYCYTNTVKGIIFLFLMSSSENV